MFHSRIVIASGCAAALAAAVVSARADVPLKPDATPDVLVSRQLLERANLTIGDVVTVAADPAGVRSQRFRVAGVYEPTPDPMKFNVERLEARLHLDDLLSLTADPSDPASNESVTSINVALADPAAAAAFSGTLAARLLLRANQTADAESATFTVIDRFHTAIAAVTVLGSTAFLLALMVIRAEERKETVGILRLIGISRKTILIEVIVEGLLVAIAGAVFGVAIALPGAARREPDFPGAIRHDAGVRARHAVHRAPVGGRRRARRRGRRRGRVVDAAAPRRGGARRPMTAFALAWRTARRYRARAVLAVVGVAVIGALNFDMLLLSHGLLLSFADLINSSRLRHPHRRQRRPAAGAAAGGRCQRSSWPRFARCRKSQRTALDPHRAGDR